MTAERNVELGASLLRAVQESQRAVLKRNPLATHTGKVTDVWVPRFVIAQAFFETRVELASDGERHEIFKSLLEQAANMELIEIGRRLINHTHTHTVVPVTGRRKQALPFKYLSDDRW